LVASTLGAAAQTGLIQVNRLYARSAVNCVDGANIAGFVKLAGAMLG
jgi:hypothetical protein